MAFQAEGQVRVVYVRFILIWTLLVVELTAQIQSERRS